MREICRLSLFIFILSLSIISCSSDRIIDEEESVRAIQIDFNESISARASVIYKPPSFVPLETTEESMFSYIEQLIVTTKYIIVLEGDPGGRIIVFDHNGEYLSNSGFMGNGPGEYHGAKGIALNKDQSELTYVEVLGRPKLVTQTINGTILRARDHKTTGIAGGGYDIIKDFKSGNYVIHIDRVGDYDRKKFISTKLCIFDDRNDTMFPAIMNTQEIKGLGYVDHNQFYRYESNIYFAPLNWDTIYIVQGTQARPFYFLNYGSHSKPSGFHTANSIEEYVEIRQSKPEYVIDHYFFRETINHMIGVFRIKGQGFKLYLNEKNSKSYFVIDKFANDWIGEIKYSPLGREDIPLTAISDTMIIVHDPLKLKRFLIELRSNLTPEEYKQYYNRNEDYIKMVDELIESDNPVIGFYPLINKSNDFSPQ
jgi:hypothetical protein